MSANPTPSFDDWLHQRSPQDLVNDYAQAYGVPPDHIERLMGQESGGRQTALSPKGARGRMQLMPGTAQQLGVNPSDPVQNIEGGIRYYSQQLKDFGTQPLADAAYNAGPGAVRKYGNRVPPYRETQQYVQNLNKQESPGPFSQWLNQQNQPAPQPTPPQAGPFEQFVQRQQPTKAPRAPKPISAADQAQQTQLAQLWQNAHDAGDPDAMRSLGRELQQKFGWEYGETTPGWPYIKPPANFQAAPGVDAMASLRATKVPTTSAYVDPRARLAAGLGGGALQGAGELLAGIPNIVAGPIQPLLHPALQQAIEQNPVSRAITSAGRSVAKKGQDIGAQAGEGFVPDVLRSTGEMVPALATGPLGIPAMAVETYAQKRGAGASPLEAGTSAGLTAAGLGLGGKIAGKLGETALSKVPLGDYLSKVLGYTVGPQAVNEVAQAIRDRKLPDIRGLGERAAKNAIVAAGLPIVLQHGGEAEAQPTAPERPQAQPEPPRGTVDAREAEASAREAAIRQTQEYKDAEAETARLLAASRANPPEITGTRQGPNPVTGTKQDIVEGHRAMGEAFDRQRAEPSHADTMAQGSVNSLSEARKIKFMAEHGGREPTPDEVANFTHDDTLEARQIQKGALAKSIADPNIKRIVFVAGEPGAAKSTLIDSLPADAHDKTVYVETHLEDAPWIKQAITDSVAAKGADNVEFHGVDRVGGPIESYKKVVARAEDTGKIVSPEYAADLTRAYNSNLPDVAMHAKDQGVKVLATQVDGGATHTTPNLITRKLPADLEDQFRELTKGSKYAEQFASQGRPGSGPGDQGGLEPAARAGGQALPPIPPNVGKGAEGIPQATGKGTQEAPEGPQATGIKHAVVEPEREIRGATPIEKLRTSMPETFDKGKAIVDDDPSGWRGKVGQWAEKPTAHSPEEQAALEYDRARLGNERRTAEAVVDAATDPSTKAAAQEKLNQIIQHIDNNDQVAIDTGTLWGQQGNVRQQMMKDDYSLTNLERQYKAKGIEITPDLHKQLEDLSAKVADAIDRVNKLAASKQEWNARAAKPRSAKMADWKASLKQGADEAFEELKRLGVTERGSGLSTDQLKLAAKWGAYKLAEKGLTLAEWTDHMVQTFGEKIRPQLADIRTQAYAEYKRIRDEAAWNQSQTPAGKRTALQDIRREILEGQAQERAANRAKAQAERAEKQSTIGAAKIQAGIAKEDAAQVAAQQAAEARQRVKDARDRQAQIERLERQKIAETAVPRARVEARRGQLQEQLEAGDFSKAPRKQYAPDRETQLAQLEVARLKRQVDQKRLTLEEAQKTPGEKFRDGAIKLHRSLWISGLPTMAHVAAQNVWRPLTWMAEDIASPIAKATMPGVAEAAPSEGRGIGTNLSSTAKGIAKTIRTAIDIPQYKRAWKTGQTDLDAQLGRPGLPPSALEMFGRLHSILRMPIQAGSYERALARRLSVTADPNDPLQLAPNMVGAYMDSQRDNFMQPAKITGALMAGLRQKAPGMAKAAEFYMPVTTIGENTAVETLRGITGVPEAMARRLWHGAFPTNETELQEYMARNKLKTAAEAQQQISDRADATMRALKKGSVGPLLATLGFAGRGILGGTSQTKEQKKERGEGAVEAKGIRVGPIDIPPYAVRAPGWTLVQLGATLGDLMDEYQQEGRPHATGEAAGRAGMEAASQTVGNIPLIRNVGDIAEAVKGPQPAPEKAEKLGAGLIRSMVVPPDVARVAKTGIPFTGGTLGDLGPTGKPVERRTQGPLDVLKEGVPIARRGLPERSTYVGDIKVDLPQPVRFVKLDGKSKYLTDKQATDYHQGRVTDLKDAFSRLPDDEDFKAMSKDEKQLVIARVKSQIDAGHTAALKAKLAPDSVAAYRQEKQGDVDVERIIDRAIISVIRKEAVNE